MGCDIHILAQRKVDGRWMPLVEANPWDYRDYGLFGFLANVRNYSMIPPLATPRGLPDDGPNEDDYLGDHSFSWLLVEELTAFDYDKTFEDRRCRVQTGPNSWSGAGLADEGAGKITTYREFLGPLFFADLEKLKALGAERIVFGFDD